MKRAYFTASLVLAVLLCSSVRAADPSPDIRLVGLEIAALQALHDMDLSKEQLQALSKLAEGASASLKSAKPGPAPSATFRTALANLREAILKGKGDKIAEARLKLDEVARKDMRPPDDPLEPTEAAVKNVPQLRKLLTASQLANFVGALDVGDPLQRLAEAAEEINGMMGEEKDALRDHAAEEVGRLVGGSTPQGKKVTERASKFLDKVAAMKPDAFEKAKANLEKEARGIVGETDSVTVLVHCIDYGLAELLSNPQLDKAITTMANKK